MELDQGKVFHLVSRSNLCLLRSKPSALEFFVRNLAPNFLENFLLRIFIYHK